MTQKRAIALTFDSLHQATAGLPATQTQEAVITAHTIAYCHMALDRSRFFTLLKTGSLPLSLIQYVFLQYYFWRNCLHQWFGFCIAKTGSCTNPDQQSSILFLANHILTDLQDNHSEMYVEFLHDLGLNTAAITAAKPSPATIAYERSFFEDFGDGIDNFYEALAALSGRELCASIRNTQILESYFDPRHLKQPTWLSLHAELEVDHFQASIRPILTQHRGDSAKLACVIQAVEHGIDRHIQYFENLLNECN